MTKTEAIIFWQKWVSPMRCVSEKEKQDILTDMLNEANDELDSKKVLVSPDLISIKPASGSPDFHDRVNLPYPARVVIKNVYQDVNEIRGDLFFEVEKNKED